MQLRFDGLARWILPGAALSCAVLSTAAFALGDLEDLSLTCTGNSYTKDGPFPTPETYSLEVTSKKPVRVTIKQPRSDRADKARIVANNSIQLKFATTKFTGEYFHFTGDLFLIAKEGRLTRLACKPS